jgi:hypothetical protein
MSYFNQATRSVHGQASLPYASRPLGGNLPLRSTFGTPTDRMLLFPFAFPSATRFRLADSTPAVDRTFPFTTGCVSSYVWNLRRAIREGVGRQRIGDRFENRPAGAVDEVAIFAKGIRVISRDYGDGELSPG